MKTQISKEVIVCDHCKKQAEMEHRYLKMVGAKNEFSGFIHVNIEPKEIESDYKYVWGGPYMSKEAQIKDFDFCGSDCLVAFFSKKL